jgi:hypothetical protein
MVLALDGPVHQQENAALEVAMVKRIAVVTLRVNGLMRQMLRLLVPQFQIDVGIRPYHSLSQHEIGQVEK